jgi:Tfp pilus assembly protein PilO
MNTGPVRDSNLGQFTATYVLSGEYRDIRRFIHALETAEEFLILDNVALSQGSDGESDLIVSVEVSTYYRAGAHGD